MWQAKVQKIKRTGGEIFLTIEFSKGNRKFTEDYLFRDLSNEQLKQMITDKLDKLYNLDTLETHVKDNDVIAPIVPVNPESPQPTPDEVARNQFLQNLRRLKNLTELIRLGVIDNKHSLYVTTLQFCVNNYLDSYADLPMV